MKENQSVSYVINQDDAAITFTVKGFAPRTLDVSKIHQNNVNLAAYKGLAQQRIVDGAAITRAKKDGTLRTEAEMLQAKHDAMWAIMDHLESGSPEWGTRARAKTEDDHSLTLRAIGQIKGITAPEASELVDRWAKSLDKPRSAVLAAFAGREDVAQAIREYRAEVTAGIDTEALMGELAA